MTYSIAAELNHRWSHDHADHGYSRHENFGGLLFCCVLWMKDAANSKRCQKKWIGSAILGTWSYNFQPVVASLSATMHNVTGYWHHSVVCDAVHYCTQVWCRGLAIVLSCS